MRLERHHNVRLYVGDDTTDGRLDVEHVHIRERMRVVVPLALLARRIMKSKEDRRFDAKPRARKFKLLRPQRTEVIDRSDRRVWFASLTVGRADERDSRTSIGEVREHAAVEDLVIGMSEDNEERSTAFHSTLTALTVTGLATGPFWFPWAVTSSVSPVSLNDQVVNAPRIIAAGLFAAIGRIVIRLPLIS